MKPFQNIPENIHLSPEQKNTLWSRIIDRIELSEKSLQKNVRMDEGKRHTPWDAYTMLSPLYPNQKSMVTKIIAWVLLAGLMGTSFASESALPGDMLYTFKVEVNESVRGAFTLGAEARAKWEIEKIERRARERAELEARSRVTVESETEIESRSQDSAEKVREVILRLQTEWKAEAATSLEGGLNTALNAIVTANARENESNSDDDTEVSSDTEVTGETDIDVSDDDTLEVVSELEGTVRSGTSSSSSLKSEFESEFESDWEESDLDVRGGLDLSAETR